MPNSKGKDEKTSGGVAVEKPSSPIVEPPKKAEKSGFLSSLGGKFSGLFKEGEALGAVPRRRRVVAACVLGFLGTNFLMFLRFFFPRALYEPKTVFRIGYPSDFGFGVDTKFQRD